MAIIVDGYCKKGKCEIGWREDQYYTYLIGGGNHSRHETGITQWLCKKRKKLDCTIQDCKKNTYIKLRK